MYPPNSKSRKLVDAAVEPISLAQAKQFLRVEVTADDDLISDLITAARIRCEQLNDRAFITQTWQFTIDYLPFAASPFLGFAWPFGQYGSGGSFNRVDRNDGSITLPSPPLIALQSMTYIDMAGDTVEVDVTPEAGNIIVSDGTPGRIYPGYGRFYPLSQPRPQAVTFVYAAGYGPDATFVPKTIMTAIRFLLAFYYENRNPTTSEPDIVCQLLSPTAWGGYA
jgi:hypothetical protein